MNDVDSIIKLAAGGSVGLTLLIFGGRFLFLQWSKSGVGMAADASQVNLIAQLTAEAKKWEEYYLAERTARIADHAQHIKDMEEVRRAADEVRAAHRDTLILLGETRNQNKMLRMSLIQRGATSEEIDAMLEIAE